MMGKHGEIILRILAILFTLMPAILLGVDNQTTYVSLLTSPNQPPLTIAAVAKWRYVSAFRYFLATNIIACSYAILSLLVSIKIKSRETSLNSIIIIIIDIIMVALLSSGIGAAIAFGILSQEGNSHLKWKKICNVFGKFCHQATAAFGVSLLGSMAFILLVVFAVFKLFRK